MSALPATPTYVRQGFAFLAAAGQARRLAMLCQRIASCDRHDAIEELREARRHIRRARDHLDFSRRRPGPRLP